jgi:hypothetical protein
VVVVRVVVVFGGGHGDDGDDICHLPAILLQIPKEARRVALTSSSVGARTSWRPDASRPGRSPPATASSARHRRPPSAGRQRDHDKSESEWNAAANHLIADWAPTSRAGATAANPSPRAAGAHLDEMTAEAGPDKTTHHVNAQIIRTCPLAGHHFGAGRPWRWPLSARRRRSLLRASSKLMNASRHASSAPVAAPQSQLATANRSAYPSRAAPRRHPHKAYCSPPKTDRPGRVRQRTRSLAGEREEIFNSVYRISWPSR